MVIIQNPNLPETTQANVAADAEEPASFFNGVFFDDHEDDDDDDGENAEWLPPPEKEEKSRVVHLQWENSRSFIKSLVEVMDWRKLSIQDVYQILLTMYVRGGGDPNDPGFSYTTVQRVVDEVRKEAVQKIKNQDFPEKVVLHFDGVIVSLGANHGKRRIEHLSITATGLGKEWKLGVFETASGTGVKRIRSLYNLISIL